MINVEFAYVGDARVLRLCQQVAAPRVGDIVDVGRKAYRVTGVSWIYDDVSLEVRYPQASIPRVVVHLDPDPFGVEAQRRKRLFRAFRGM